MNKKHSALKISLIAVVFGLLLGFLVVLITGRSPMDMLYAFIRSLTGYNLAKPDKPINLMYVFNWLLEAMPIILTGLSVGFAYRTGLFNIGGEGQFMVGSTAASFVALTINMPLVPHIILCLVVGMLAGALWGFIPGFLKAYHNINEVVVCIMLNYIGLFFSNYLVRTFLEIDPNTNARTVAFPITAVLPKVTDMTASQFNYGFVLVVLCLVMYWFILEKTTFGYSLRATGFNSEAARFAGMKVKRNTVYSMMIAGALSGAAGAIVVLGVFKYGRIFTLFDNYGFDGISVALVGAANAVGIALSGLLFALLKSGGNNLQLFNIPKEISQLIQAAIIFFVAIQYGVILMLNKFDGFKLKLKGGKKA
ncbi:ABC transporter permease [Erysipelotrichaceae bacterium OH741_COT-311]|nr:ABC transporter permease [Erysipelotrichaceae bacterium OH741_COT-311]